MKKLFIIISMLFLWSVFAEPMNTLWGYKNLQWGSTVEEVKKAGYNIVPSSKHDSDMVQSAYNKPVASFDNNGKELLTTIFYNNKLFATTTAVIFNAKPKKVTQKLMDNAVAQLKSLYGNNIKFTNDKKNMMSDAVVNKSGNVESFSIMISIDWGKNVAFVSAIDWDVWRELDASQKFASKKGIVDQLSAMASKLTQDEKNGKKASLAFIALTSDNRVTAVENYVTDGLTESVFNTGKMRIIERANLEKILSEQKFQLSGIVDESQAKDIGKVAGVDYVCYGTIKDSVDSLSVSARLVDVENGEIAAMARATIKKDDYLTAHSNDAPATNNKVASSSTQSNGNSGSNGGATSGNNSNSGAKDANAAPAKPKVKSLWTCRKSRNDFDEYTTYTFILRGATDDKYIFFGYDKNDNTVKSIVRAGFTLDGYFCTGNYDIKAQDGNVSSKRFSRANWSFNTGWKDGKEQFSFSYNSGESARFVLNIIANNDFVTLRNNDKTQRFQTAGFWDALAENGITKEEIEAAIANEEF